MRGKIHGRAIIRAPVLLAFTIATLALAGTFAAMPAMAQGGQTGQGSIPVNAPTSGGGTTTVNMNVMDDSGLFNTVVVTPDGSTFLAVDKNGNIQGTVTETPPDKRDKTGRWTKPVKLTQPLTQAQLTSYPLTGLFGSHVGLGARYPKSWDKLMDEADVPEGPEGYDCIYDWVDDLIDYHDYLLAMGANHDSPQMVALDNLIDDAEDYACWFGCGYVEGIAGFNFTETGSLIPTSDFDNNPKSSFGNSGLFGLGAGIEPYHGVYTGFEYTYRGSMGTDYTATGIEGKGSANSSTFMFDTVILPGEVYKPLRAYTTIPGTTTRPRVELYTWGGIGMSMNSTDNVNVTGGSVIAGTTHDSLAWGLGAGLRFNMSSMGWKNTAFDLGYRYDHLGQFTTNDKFTNGSYEAPLKTDVNTNNLFLRGIYKF